MDKLQWHFNQNTKLAIHENASENIVCEVAAILFRGRWVKVIVIEQCLSCCLLTVVNIVYWTYLTSFHTRYVPSILSTLILETSKCHCVAVGCSFGMRKWKIPRHNTKKIWHKSVTTDWGNIFCGHHFNAFSSYYSHSNSIDVHKGPIDHETAWCGSGQTITSTNGNLLIYSF